MQDTKYLTTTMSPFNNHHEHHNDGLDDPTAEVSPVMPLPPPHYMPLPPFDFEGPMRRSGGNSETLFRVAM